MPSLLWMPVDEVGKKKILIDTFSSTTETYKTGSFIVLYFLLKILRYLRHPDQLNLAFLFSSDVTTNLGRNTRFSLGIWLKMWTTTTFTKLSKIDIRLPKAQKWSWSRTATVEVLASSDFQTASSGMPLWGLVFTGLHTISYSGLRIQSDWIDRPSFRTSKE